MDFYRQLGTGVSSLTFGVALSVFIIAAAYGFVSGLSAWLLFAASFLLMLRFWWRYNELFVQSIPSRNYWHFLFDFAVSFFGIMSVLAVNDIRAWAMLGGLAMMSSLIRCGLSWKSAGKAMRELKKTAIGALAMLVIFGAVYLLSASISHATLAAAMLVIVLVFVIYSSRK
ncbi:MAG: hypothetical protein HY517_03155 [Candidatus Aenigmarchaeota archaeon]|nr:hypothetical protein [Candidatus Aenigmarchaeota archaeon]